MKQSIVENQGNLFFVENSTTMSDHFSYDIAMTSGIISSPSGPTVRLWSRLFLMGEHFRGIGGIFAGQRSLG